MERLIRYLKQFAAWATGLTDNYLYNPTIRATVNIVALMVILGSLLVTVSAWVIETTQNNTLGSVRYYLKQVLAHHTVNIQNILQSLQLVRDHALTFELGTLVVLTVIFGYLIVHFAVSPIRDALHLQKRFIGNIAHEIRTPLAIMKTGSEVALMDDSLPTSVREVMESNIVELNRISEIINNLLSLDTLLSPRHLKTQSVDMSVVVTTVVDRYKALAASRNISIVVENTLEEEALVTGNSTALEQVVTNLIKNSLNYTPLGGGAVRITVERDHRGRVAVLVADLGIGIAEKDLRHVFEPFYRADSSRLRGVGAETSGLGLAIVNEIMRLHRGTISIKSSLGHGTTVMVSLPSVSHRVSGKPKPGEPSVLEGGFYEVSLDFS